MRIRKGFEAPSLPSSAAFPSLSLSLLERDGQANRPRRSRFNGKIRRVRCIFPFFFLSNVLNFALTHSWDGFPIYHPAIMRIAPHLVAYSYTARQPGCLPNSPPTLSVPALGPGFPSVIIPEVKISRGSRILGASASRRIPCKDGTRFEWRFARPIPRSGPTSLRALQREAVTM